ncbi:hypothetical protein SAMN05443582_104287 [Phyllobacterium sp. OV277]|nr:hypothetical protein SAMN05443582_104287 [Phyllobacterium sp. OV277]
MSLARIIVRLLLDGIKARAEAINLPSRDRHEGALRRGKGDQS